MDEIIRVLIDRLVRKGIEPGTIPACLRDVANTMASNSELSLPELNRRMQLLGWGDFEVDDHTLQLIRAVFETEGEDTREREDSPRMERTIDPGKIFQSQPSFSRKTKGNYESEIQSSS